MRGLSVLRPSNYRILRSCKAERRFLDFLVITLLREVANDAVQIHGAYGYSNEYPVERHLRNSKAPVIYEGTREIHTIMQADYVLGYRKDKPLRKMLPAWNENE